MLRRIVVMTAFLVPMLAPAAASAAIPTPDPMAANCHGRAMGIGASTYKGTATYAKSVGISAYDAHFVFMEMQGCHS